MKPKSPPSPKNVKMEYSEKMQKLFTGETHTS